jgi:hypothetical protein
MMERQEAMEFVAKHGLERLQVNGSNLTALAVAAKDGRSITEASVLLQSLSES